VEVMEKNNDKGMLSMMKMIDDGGDNKQYLRGKDSRM
jgi:hypothetical protein